MWRSGICGFLLAYFLVRPLVLRYILWFGTFPSQILKFFPGRLGALGKLATLMTCRTSKINRPQVFPAKGATKKRVALLAGCIQQVVASQINEASVRLLNRLGCEVTVIEDFGCCGAIEYHLGKKEQAKKRMLSNLNSFNEAEKKLGNTASSHSRLLYFQKTIENLGLGTRIVLTLDLEQTYWRFFLVNLRLFPGIKDFICQLKSDGVITANITDLTAQIQFRKLVYLGLDEYFDYVVTSEEAGRDKPDKAPFDIILSKIGVDPSEVWMIGDNPVNDIEGAVRAGMIPVQKLHNGVIVSEVIN